MNENLYYRFRAEYPLIWNEHGDAILGVEKSHRLFIKPDNFQQALFLAIQGGAEHQTLSQIATNYQRSEVELSAFLRELSQYTHSIVRGDPPKKPFSVVVGAPETEGVIAKHLRLASFIVTTGAPKPGSKNQLVILADRFMPHKIKTHKFLYEGNRVLPIRFSDKTVLVGPVIDEGDLFETVTESWNKNYPIENIAYHHQVLHRRVPTETSSILNIVTGLILNQIEDFLLRRSKVPKTHVLTKSESLISIETLPVESPGPTKIAMAS